MNPELGDLESVTSAMNIAELLSADRVQCDSPAGSKKRALDALSEKLAEAFPNLTQREVFDSLIGRERLGSTGLGHGIAIPHGRLAGIDQAAGAFMTLADGIDYDAPDRQPVDVLFALVVPEVCTDQHLQILATLAQMFADPTTVQQLRQCDSPERLLALFNEWQVSDAA